jgi:nicotinate-nucleotide--dimethylbenzimidazole phosphoribosyltransferase
VLKRILAIIRAPNEPLAGSIAAPAAAAPSVPAARPAEPVPAPGAEAAAMAAAVSALAPTVADIVAAEGSGPDVVAVEPTGAAQPGEAGGVGAAKGVIDDAADDILMPLPGPLTVDQAVDAMLKARGRVDVAATEEPAGVAAPVEPTAGEPPAVTDEPIAREPEFAAAAGSEPLFVIEVPEFTVAMPAPVPPAELSEPAPVAETVAAAIAEPAEHGAPLAEAAAPASTRLEEPPLEAVAAALAPPVTPAPPAIAASEPPPPGAPPADPPAQPVRSAPRHPALAAITALSDEEKIALFS